MTKKILSLMLTFCFVISLCACNKDKENKTENEPNGTSTSSIKESDIKVPDWATLIEAKACGDLLKIDFIISGLDSYSMQSDLYSVSSGEKFGSISVDDGLWATGILDDGMYLADLKKGDVTIYDKSCSVKKSFKIEVNDDVVTFLGISPDGKYAFHRLGKSANFFITDIYSDKSSIVYKQNCIANYIGFNDGKFILDTVSDGILAFDPQNGKSESLYSTRDIYYKSEYYGVEVREPYFVVNTPLDSAEKFSVKMKQEQDYIVGSYNGGLYTVNNSSDGVNTVRDYNINNSTVYDFQFDNNISGIIRLDNNSTLIAYTDINNKANIKIYNPEQMGKENLEVSEYTRPEQLVKENVVTKEELDSNNKKIIKSVPLLNQFPEFPTGCESVSTVMALKFKGYDITVTNFINYLDKSDKFYTKDGVFYGPDPNKNFVGNPKSKTSFGCYAPVIVNAVSKFIGKDKVKNTTGTSIENLCKNYIDNDTPVLLWASISMSKGKESAVWTLENGNSFFWISNEHCLVLIGYDDEFYYFNDPYVGAQVKYTKEKVQKCFDCYGQQSVVIL